MSPLRAMAIRRTMRAERAAAVEHCDMVFAAARGVPRQGALRAELEARRTARAAVCWGCDKAPAVGDAGLCRACLDVTTTRATWP